MCKLFTPPTVTTVMSSTTVFAGFSGLSNTGAEDEWYHCAEIKQVMQWCYACRSECPSYESNSESEQGFNCDDFAKCFAAYCRRKKYSNAVWEAWGDCDGVSHAWSVVQCPDGKYEIEPQTGVVWPFKSNPNYKARVIK